MTYSFDDEFQGAPTKKGKKRKPYTPRPRPDRNAPVTPPKRPARDYAMWLMGRREYSRKELEQRLKLKGYEIDVINTALDWMSEHNYQSDERFAASLVRQQSNRLGNRRLSQSLKQKGISEDIAVESMELASDEEERAIQVIQKFSRVNLADKEIRMKTKQKAARFLMSRGFSWDLFKKAWATLIESSEDDDEFE